MERPEKVQKMKDQETAVNRAALSGDIEALEAHLIDWRQTIKSMCMTFYVLGGKK